MTPKCSDFYCLQIPYYPSKVKCLKVKDYNDPRWHSESKVLIDAHQTFLNGFLQKVFGNGKDVNYFYMNYMCFSRETIHELLEVWHNIRYMDGEGHHQYLIPSQYVDLILWARLNKPPHSKEPKRYRIGWMSYIHQDTELYWTPKALEFTIQQRERFPNTLPPIEELTEADRLVLR